MPIPTLNYSTLNYQMNVEIGVDGGGYMRYTWCRLGLIETTNQESKMNSYQAIATKITNAEDRFISAVMEQFSKTKIEAEIILAVFKQYKIVKIDPIGGQFTLSQGIFWDADVMDNALKQER
jgi:hypothetical protein